MRKISEVYVSKWCIYNPCIELSKGGSNSQHSMLDFHKETPPHEKNKFQVILPTFMLASLKILYGFGAWCIYGRFSDSRCQNLQYSIKQ